MAVCVFLRLLQASRNVEETRKEIHKALWPAVETRRFQRIIVKDSPGGIQKDHVGRSHCSATGATSHSSQEEIQVPLLWEQKDKLQREGKKTT